MLWLLKDVGTLILGVAGLYLFCFGTLSRKTDESNSGDARVWMTYIALAVLAIGAIVWVLPHTFKP